MDDLGPLRIFNHNLILISVMQLVEVFIFLKFNKVYRKIRFVLIEILVDKRMTLLNITFLHHHFLEVIDEL